MPGKPLADINGLKQKIKLEEEHIAFQMQRIEKYPKYKDEFEEKIRKIERRIRIWKACLEALETKKSTWNV